MALELGDAAFESPVPMNPASPTPLPEVNAVLAELVARWREILGSNLVGAYLQGSFAVGDFTERSDVDFVVVVKSDIEPPVLARLQQLHAEMHRKPSYWAQHLEGSYAPAAIIRKLTDTPRDPPGEPRDAAFRDPQTGLGPKYYPFPFLGNGWDRLVRSEHDNSQVVRWIVRERGVTLHGPPPSTLIDRVTGDELRAEVRVNLPLWTGSLLSGAEEITAVWHQAFMVTVICRMLHTLETGEIHSKAAATSWALRTLPSSWHPLITRAAATWAGSQATWHDRPAAPEVAATLEFMRFALTTHNMS